MIAVVLIMNRGGGNNLATGGVFTPSEVPANEDDFDAQFDELQSEADEERFLGIEKALEDIQAGFGNELAGLAEQFNIALGEQADAQSGLAGSVQAAIDSVVNQVNNALGSINTNSPDLALPSSFFVNEPLPYEPVAFAQPTSFLPAEPEAVQVTDNRPIQGPNLPTGNERDFDVFFGGGGNNNRSSIPRGDLITQARQTPQFDLLNNAVSRIAINVKKVVQPRVDVSPNRIVSNVKNPPKRSSYTSRGTYTPPTSRNVPLPTIGARPIQGPKPPPTQPQPKPSVSPLLGFNDFIKNLTPKLVAKQTQRGQTATMD